MIDFGNLSEDRLVKLCDILKILATENDLTVEKLETFAIKLKTFSEFTQLIGDLK